MPLDDVVSCGADLVTGEVVDKLMHHREIVRDCSWHPHEQEVRCALAWHFLSAAGAGADQ